MKILIQYFIEVSNYTSNVTYENESENTIMNS